jgi:AraC family transcriptional activator of pobA
MYDPSDGGESLGIEAWTSTRKPFEPARTNYFTVYLIESGSGVFWADAARHPFQADSLLFFVPYQHIRFAPDSSVRAEVVRFHANFLCVETFHAEAGCSGTLFNDPYGSPIVALDEAAKVAARELFARIRHEHETRALAFADVMLAHLKILLIQATRWKAIRSASCSLGNEHRHPVLAELRELIEHHYHEWHTPAEYADALHHTSKTLGRIVREQLGTTPTELIRSRILTHAKWQLLHTLKPVKELARELGFADELYFSRLFKKAVGRSPKSFREFETRIRGGSNLSMASSHASIL